MPAYRIVEQHRADGRVRFVPQKRFLWWWVDCTCSGDGGSTFMVACDTYDEALQHIRYVEQQPSPIVKEITHEVTNA